MNSSQQADQNPLALRGRLNLTGTAGVVLMVAATGLVMVAHLLFLVRYPPVLIDEPWYANAAWSWLQGQGNFDTMHAGVLDQFGYEWLRWPLIGNAAWLVSFATLGLGLFQARFVSWLFGAGLLVATALVGRRSYGTVTGALAALMLSLSPPFLAASHYARPDIMLAALVMAAFGVAQIALERNRPWAHLLAALLLGLSLDIHQNGVLFFLALAVVYAVAYGAKMLRRSGTWLCAAGGILGTAYYAAVHILPSPAAYQELFRFNFGGYHRVPLTKMSPPVFLWSVIGEIGRYNFYENGLDFALIGASIVFLLARRRKADRSLLAFAASALLGFVLFHSIKHELYAILLYPFAMLMVAETLVSLVRRGRPREPQRVFMVGLLVLFLFNSAVHFLQPVARHRDYDYSAITARIESVIPEGARVMGLPHWWLGLSDHEYRSSLGLTYYHFYNESSLTQGFEAIRPDIIIVDDLQRELLVDEGYFPLGPGFAMYRLPSGEFNGLLAQRGERLLEFSDQWHGRFEIYAIHWD